MESTYGGIQLPSISDELIKEAEQKGADLFFRLWKELQESGKIEEMTEDTNWSSFAPMNESLSSSLEGQDEDFKVKLIEQHLCLCSLDLESLQGGVDGEEMTLQSLDGSSIAVRNGGGSLKVNDYEVKEIITTQNATILIVECNLFSDNLDCGKSRVIRSPFLRVI